MGKKRPKRATDHRSARPQKPLGKYARVKPTVDPRKRPAAKADGRSSLVAGRRQHAFECLACGLEWRAPQLQGFPCELDTCCKCSKPCKKSWCLDCLPECRDPKCYCHSKRPGPCARAACPQCKSDYIEWLTAAWEGVQTHDVYLRYEKHLAPKGSVTLTQRSAKLC